MNKSLRTFWGFAALSVGLLIGITCCTPTPPKTASTLPSTRPVATAPAADLETRWTLFGSRRQTAYIKLNLPVIVTGTNIQIAPALKEKGQLEWIGAKDSITVCSSRIMRSTLSGPMVDQLTGSPIASADVGSYIVPLASAHSEAGDNFMVAEPMPLFFRIDISPAQDTGTYRFPVTINSPHMAAETVLLVINVADIALPTQPRVLGVATTTTDDLGRIFPASFGTINPANLDRADPDDKAAIAQLDAIVKTAHENGLAFFVEDLSPRLKVDEVGRVILDWDAYDRVMQPYMDGSAFTDHVPQPVWLAPVPPNRVRDSATQLRQFIEGCATHFAEKGWIATPAFMHPALIAPEGIVDQKLRDDVGKVLRLHMNHEILAVTTPDATVPQARLWVVDDADPRLPPIGGGGATASGGEQTIRLWPWLCAARSAPTSGNVKGFVWRDALEAQSALSPSAPNNHPLLIAGPPGKAGEPAPILPALRMVWLSEGLNDTALLGLLENRSDPALVNDVLAGIVGRTGQSSDLQGADLPTVPPGYLYAGWPEETATWDAMPAMLQKLVLSSDPGQQVKVAADDPLYVAAKIWLANSRRPVARVGGYRFNVAKSRDGNILTASLDMLVENPVDAPVKMSLRYLELPGDFMMQVAPDAGDSTWGTDYRSLSVKGYGLKRVVTELSGHLDSLAQTDVGGGVVMGGNKMMVEFRENDGGALLRMPMQLPVYTMKKTDAPPRLDGSGEASEGWPAEPKAHPPMSTSLRYMARPDLIRGTLRIDDQPATARWTYDNDFLYVRIRCPQQIVSDERNNDWSILQNRWWGTDGVQIQLSGKYWRTGEATPIVQIAFKPGGAMLTRTAQINGDKPLEWTEGPPSGGGVVKYAINLEKSEGRITGYVVEAAIPRKWFPTPMLDNDIPCWRVNVLHFRASDMSSTSWSGPIVNDNDVAMMGLLLGSEQ